LTRNSFIREPDKVTPDVDPEVARARARVGQTLRGKWRLEQLIGVGGMAAVYAATHRNGMRGAVKVLHLPLSLSRDIRERFLREGYAANRVEHPGVVRVLDDDAADDGAIFLVMELLEGQTVADRAEASPGRRLAPAEVLAVADAALDVLAAAHDKGIVHRDIKPDNLFLTGAGELKVLDFGIARLRELGSASATTTGATMGTPAFMPPEQASGRWSLVDGRSDLWAVGATMFTLLTGRTVHEAATVQLILAAAMTQPARPLASVMPTAPRLAAVIDTALAFDVAARWPSARAMQQAVRAARAELAASPQMISIGTATTPSAPGSVARPGVTPYIERRGAAATSYPTTSPLSSATLGKAGGKGTSTAFFLGGAVAAIGLGVWLLARAARPEAVAPASSAVSAVPDSAVPPSPATALATTTGASSAEAPPSAAPTPTEAASAPTATAVTSARNPKRGKPTGAPPSRKHEGIY
jgi:eukaryotic-like serine/threonine-protein kinase